MLVVGGGPAGLYTAQRLASRGVRVRVLEEHGEIGEPVHCTGIVGDEVFALPGVPADSVVGWPHAAQFHSPAGHAFVCDANDERVCIIDRGVFDRALADRAAAAGAVVTTGARVVGLEVGPEAVEVTADVGGGQQRFRAEACVLATGASYRFQRALGWGAPALALGSAQTEMAAGGGENLELFFRDDTSPRGFAWLAPLSRRGERRAKVGVMAPKMPASVLGRVAADLTQAGRVLGPMGPVIVRPLPLAPLSRTYGDRVLAVGDAAGLVKPTTGGGIYYSLLSAGWAADTVAAACEAGRFSASVLSAYERTWREHLGRELAVGSWFRQIASRLTVADIDFLAQLTITDGIMPIVQRTKRFNWHGGLILGLLRHPDVFRIATRLALETAGLAKPRG